MCKLIHLMEFPEHFSEYEIFWVNAASNNICSYKDNIILWPRYYTLELTPI